VSESSAPEPETSPTPATPARSKGRPWRALALGLLLASFPLGLGLWLARSVIVTALVASSLDGRGVRCEALSIDASGTLSELEIAPTRCEVAHGPIARVAWDGPMRTRLEGASLSELEAPTLSLVRRPSAEEPDAAASGALGVWVQAPARVSGVVHFASRLSEIDSPALRIAHVVVTREDAARPELELVGLVAPAREAGAATTISIEELSLATSQGPFGVSATPRLRAVEVEANATHGSLEGAVDATVDLPVLGALQLPALTGGRRVRVTAEHLDAEPRWSVELE
jgi:hypothetical protein